MEDEISLQEAGGGMVQIAETVLRHVVRGHSREQIARALAIAPQTVDRMFADALALVCRSDAQSARPPGSGRTSPTLGPVSRAGLSAD